MPRISLKDAYDNSSVIKQINDLTDKSEIATEVSVEASAIANESIGIAKEANKKADSAKATADGLAGEIKKANDTAKAADDKSQEALDTANGLLVKVNEADAKAESAIVQANASATTASNAQQIAESARAAATAVEAKATEALTTASAADRKANSAFGSAESAATAAGDAQKLAEQVDAKTIVNKNNIVNVESRVGSLEVRQGQDEAKMDLSIKNVVVVAGEADAKVRMTKQSGAVTETAVPIASASQTGVMNAQTFRNITDIDERVRTLEEGYNVYWGTFPSSTPSQEQIQATYEGAGGPSPTPIGATVADAQKKLSYVWTGSEWVKPDIASIPAFGEGTLGLVKGGSPSVDGVIIAEPGGTGSVQGWDALKGRVTNLEANTETVDGQISALTGRVSKVESKATANEASIEATASMVSDNSQQIAGLKNTVGDAGKGLVKQVNDVEAVADGASATATSADTIAKDAQTKANSAITNITSQATLDKVVFSGTRNDGVGVDVEIPGVTTASAGVVKGSEWAHVVKDNTAEEITGAYTFKTAPTGVNLSVSEQGTQRYMPASQITELIKETDDAVAGIGITASMSGQTLSMEVNGKSASVEIPGGGQPKQITTVDELFTFLASSKPGDRLIFTTIGTSGSTTLYDGVLTRYTKKTPYTSNWRGNVRISKGVSDDEGFKLMYNYGNDSIDVGGGVKIKRSEIMRMGDVFIIG